MKFRKPEASDLKSSPQSKWRLGMTLAAALSILIACACPGAREFHDLDGNRINELKAMLLKMDEKELDKFISSFQFAKNFVPKQIILRFKDGTATSKVQETLKTLSASKNYEFKSTNALLINIPSAVTRQDIIAIAAALNEVKSVDYAVPNAIIQVAALPNDPEFPKLDGLHHRLPIERKAEA